MRNGNGELSMVEVLRALQDRAPSAFQAARVVGRWVWVEFADKPGADVREALKDIGFRWNPRRFAWQHSCGVPSRHSVADPRGRYGSVPAASIGLTDESGAA